MNNMFMSLTDLYNYLCNKPKPSPEYCSKLVLTIGITLLAIYCFYYTYSKGYIIPAHHTLLEDRAYSITAGFLSLFCLTLFPKEEEN